MRTSRRASSSAFSLVELSALIVVIALLTALVVPKLAAFDRGLRSKLSMDAVQRLASRARELALSSGQPVQLGFNDTDGGFEIRQRTQDGTDNVIASADLHPDIQAVHFVAGPTEVTASDWIVTFYPDATSDGGSMEVDEGGIARTLVIGSKTALSRWQDGATPSNENERWQAGEFERRG